jgi:hypothetical protein
MSLLDLSWMPDASTIATESIGPIVGAVLSATGILIWGAGKRKPLSDFVDGRVKMLLESYESRIEQLEDELAEFRKSRTR